MNHRTLLAPVLGSALLLAAACEKNSGASDETSRPAAAVQTAPADQPVKVVEAAVAEEAAMGCHGDGEAKYAEKYGEAKKEHGGCNQWDEAAADVIQREVPEDAEWHTFKVSGMTCGGCERRVIATVGELDGVLAVEADAELGQVRIALADGADSGLAADRIGSLGYQVER